jgi:dipeptidyl aminopeptidase/acylaminoacyl peptidase
MRSLAPFFLPDGRRFLYSLAVPAGILSHGIYAGSLDSQAPKRVRDGGSMPAYANGHLLFVENNALMAQPFDVARLEVTGDAVPLGDQVQIGGGPQSSGTIAVSSSGVIAYQDGTNSKASLLWFDEDGRPQGTLSEPRGFGYPQLSPNGRQLAISIREDFTRNRDVWVYDTTRGSRTRVTDQDSDDFSPVWSPDGKQIIYTAPRDGDLNLYVHDFAAGGTDRRLLDRDGVEIPTSWSTDGQFILFQSQSPNADIFMLSMRDLKVEPFANSRFSEIAAKFSPDGRWIAYVSDETGLQEVYVAPVGRAAAKTVVSTDGGFGPRWRHDGKELFYIREDGTLMAVPIHVSAATVTAGQPRRLFQSTFTTRLQTPFDVTSDGRLLVMADVDDPMPQAITLIINWPASLRKQ